jgi:hypothetical protein
MTEQIRGWTFQLFLDGELLSLAATDPREFEKRREARWAQFMTQAANAAGLMATFVDGEVSQHHHSATPYADAKVASLGLEAYQILRFSKQISYMKYKRDGFAVQDERTESIAKWSLFTALILAGVQIAFAITAWLGHTHTRFVPTLAATLAILLVVISAIVRTYRNALGLAEQRVRYEAKWVRLLTLRAAFDEANQIDARIRIVGEVEMLLQDELRDFLRQTRNASFVL